MSCKILQETQTRCVSTSAIRFEPLECGIIEDRKLVAQAMGKMHCLARVPPRDDGHWLIIFARTTNRGSDKGRVLERQHHDKEGSFTQNCVECLWAGSRDVLVAGCEW